MIRSATPFVLIATVALSACAVGDAPRDTIPATPPGNTGASSSGSSGLPFGFPTESLLRAPSRVDCTLSDGSRSACVQLVVGPAPRSASIGPWCPRNISDGPDVSGIWLEGGRVYDADGEFIQNLSSFYDDPGFQMFDPATGKINVTDTKTSCEAAARPDVDPEYQNHCVECEVSYLPSDAVQVFVIPATPMRASAPVQLGRNPAGLSFRGVRLDAPAPVDAILSAHTLAPFDDCGGHVNTAVGYHQHAVRDCEAGAAHGSGHGRVIGLALDGFAIFETRLADGSLPQDIDRCFGHASAGIDYHYHAGAEGANQILGCHAGPTGCALSDESATCDATQTARRGPPGGRGGERPPRPQRPPR